MKKNSEQKENAEEKSNSESKQKENTEHEKHISSFSYDEGNVLSDLDDTETTSDSSYQDDSEITQISEDLSEEQFVCEEDTSFKIDQYEMYFRNLPIFNNYSDFNSQNIKCIEIFYGSESRIAIACLFEHTESKGGKKRRKINQVLSQPFLNGIEYLKKKYLKEGDSIQIFFLSSFIELNKEIIFEVFHMLFKYCNDQVVIISESNEEKDHLAQIMENAGNKRVAVSGEIEYELVLIDREMQKKFIL